MSGGAGTAKYTLRRRIRQVRLWLPAVGGGVGGGGKGFNCPGCPLPAQGSGGTLAAPREGSALLKDARARRVSSKMAEGKKEGPCRAGGWPPGGGGKKECAGGGRRGVYPWRGRGRELERQWRVSV